MKIFAIYGKNPEESYGGEVHIVVANNALEAIQRLGYEYMTDCPFNIKEIDITSKGEKFYDEYYE